MERKYAELQCADVGERETAMVIEKSLCNNYLQLDTERRPVSYLSLVWSYLF